MKTLKNHQRFSYLCAKDKQKNSAPINSEIAAGLTKRQKSELNPTLDFQPGRIYGSRLGRFSQYHLTKNHLHCQNCLSSFISFNLF
jgi:hypothetical protein